MSELAVRATAIVSDVTEMSSKGALPQLTDVLHALTESHELLLSKLQSVQLERASVVPILVEEFPHAHFQDFVDPLLPTHVDAKIDATNDVHREFRVDQISESDSSTEQIRLASSESDVSPGLAAASPQVTHSEASAQSRISVEVVTPGCDMHADVPAEGPTPPEWPRDLHTDQTGADSANRNYNFFDELDATLAHLKNPESGTGSTDPRNTILPRTEPTSD